MFLLMTLISFWAEDPAYVVNQDNCGFGHIIELPNDYRRNRLLKTCFETRNEKPTPTGGYLQAKTVRPLKELMANPAD